MTELQPTEIELTGKKKKPVSLSRKKIVFFSLLVLFLLLAAGLTAFLANRASKAPSTIQQQILPTVEPVRIAPTVEGTN